MNSYPSDNTYASFFRHVFDSVGADSLIKFRRITWSGHDNYCFIIQKANNSEGKCVAFSSSKLYIAYLTGDTAKVFECSSSEKTN